MRNKALTAALCAVLAPFLAGCSAAVLDIWRCDEAGVYIKDPDDPSLMEPISWERFGTIGWGSYFYAVRSEQV